jgi:tRNA A-37 threonylcarbamoyl transferase component Bud32
MSEDLIGKTLGGYAIEALVGRGGMATVYLARQTSMNRTVALKILQRDQMKDEAYLKRFEREVSIVAQLEHRSIVPVYDHGQHEGQPFIAMRYMAGGSLDAYLQEGALAQERVLSLCEQIAPALDYAHSKNVLHRDLKPSNVLLDDAGGAYITDFGIARVFGDGTTTEVTLTQNGVVGTPAYMSPEQAQGKELDGRSDIYSLGIVLFELLTGRRPFNAETPYSIAVMQVTAEPPSPRQFNPSLSLSLEHVLLKALRKRPEERFQTAVELTEALRMAIENPGGFSPHDTQPNRRPMAAATQPIAVQAMPAFSTPQPLHTAGMMPNPATPPTPVAAMRPVQIERTVKRKAPANKGEDGWWMGATLGALLGCILLSMIGALLMVFGGRFFESAPAIATNVTPPQTPTAAATSTPALGALQTEIAADDRNIPSLATLEALRTTPTPSSGTPILSTTPVAGRWVYSALIASGTRIIQHLFVRGERGSTSAQLTTGTTINTAPAVSPDGQRVAFVSNRDGDFDVYVMDINGGMIQRVLDTPVDEYMPVWMPDGDSLLLASDAYGDGALVLLRVALDGSGEAALIYGAEGIRAFRPMPSPDGRRVVFTRGRPNDARTWEVVILDLASGALLPLTDNTVLDHWGVFSRSGMYVYGVRIEDTQASIWRISSDGQGTRDTLYTSTGWLSNLMLSPEGDRLLFSETPRSSATGQLLVMPVDAGSAPQALDIIAGTSADWIP